MALRDLGGLTQVTQSVHEVRTIWLDLLWRDARHAVRSLRRTPAFTSLAAESGLPSAEWLQGAFAGAAFHHLQDVSNQIHTVQVGIYEFFEAATGEDGLEMLQELGHVPRLFPQEDRLVEFCLEIELELFHAGSHHRFLRERSRDVNWGNCLRRLRGAGARVVLCKGRARIAKMPERGIQPNLGN